MKSKSTLPTLLPAALATQDKPDAAAAAKPEPKTVIFNNVRVLDSAKGSCFIDESDARTELFGYIEGYYNTQRRHSSLNHTSPPRSRPL